MNASQVKSPYHSEFDSSVPHDNNIVNAVAIVALSIGINAIAGLFLHFSIPLMRQIDVPEKDSDREKKNRMVRFSFP